jgi:hypothetical protein
LKRIMLSIRECSPRAGRRRLCACMRQNDRVDEGAQAHVARSDA